MREGGWEKIRCGVQDMNGSVIRDVRVWSEARERSEERLMRRWARRDAALLDEEGRG